MRFKITLLSTILLLVGLSSNGSLGAQHESGNIKDIGKGIITPTTVVVLAEINFGAFYPGDLGGTISVDPRGFLTVTGTTRSLPIGGIPSPITLEIKSRPATMIQVVFPREILLYGVNGGQMVFRPGPLEYGNVFVSPMNAPDGFTVNMGGTLEVGTVNENPPGDYFGSFSFTIVSE